MILGAHRDTRDLRFLLASSCSRKDAPLIHSSRSPAPRSTTGAFFVSFSAKALFADCKIRGAPISVSVLGRTELVNGKPRSALDLLFALWLAAAREVELHQGREGEIEAAGTGDAVTEVCVVVQDIVRVFYIFPTNYTFACSFT